MVCCYRAAGEVFHPLELESGNSGFQFNFAMSELMSELMACQGTRKSRMIPTSLSRNRIQIPESCPEPFFSFDGEFTCHHSMDDQFDFQLFTCLDVFQETITFIFNADRQVFIDLHTAVYHFFDIAKTTRKNLCKLQWP